jgi:hypothetical protein
VLIIVVRGVVVVKFKLIVMCLLQYPSPLCRLTWVVTQVIGLHVKLTILREYDVASMTNLGMLISNIVLTVDTSAH